MEAHWDGKIVNEGNVGLKYIQTYSNSSIYELVKMQLSVQMETKFCMVRQVIQSANCVLARRLKNELADLILKAVVHQDSE